MSLARAALAAFLWSGAARAAATPRVPFEQFALDNGLRVVVSEDRSVPVAALAVIYQAGSRQEERGRSGFAHLFEHMMFEGSRNAPKGVFDRLLETYGGDNNASTHDEFVLYYELVPSNALPIAFWLESDRISGLSVTREAMANQIEVVKEEKRMRVDNEPYGPLLAVEIASHSFSNWQNAHPTIGTFADLDAAGLADVRSFFDAYYSPRNAIVAVVGDVDAREVRRLAADYLGWIPNKGRRPVVDGAEPPPAGGPRRVRVPDPHAKLPALAVTWGGMPARGSADYHALVLLGRLLAGGKSSRLYQKLVKESEAAVDVSGGLGFPVADPSDYAAPGLFGFFVIHKADRSASEIERAVEGALGEIAASGAPERELDRVKTKFRSDWLRDSQTALERASRLATAALLDGSPAAANALEPAMRVTSADLKRVAAAYFKPEAASWFEAVPAARP